MKVSVVIPVYNVKLYLERCIKSVLNQTYKDLELILVDDGSTDGSGELADQLATHDSRIHVIHQENHGLSAARNVGLQASIGEYVIFLDSDDEWLLPDGLEKMLNKSPNGCDLIVFKRVDFWQHGRREDSKDYDLEAISKMPDGSSVFSYLVRTQQLQISSCFLMTRRQLLIDNQVFFPPVYVDEDVCWTLRLWLFVKTVSFHNLPFYGYYHRTDSLSTTYTIQIFHSNDRMLTNWEELCSCGCANSDSILSFLANIWVSLGYRTHLLNKAERPEAVKILERHKDLLNHASSNKAGWASKTVKAIGVQPTTLILGIYWDFKTYLKTISYK